MKKTYVVFIAIAVLSYMFYISHRSNAHYQNHIDFITKEIQGTLVLDDANKLLLDTFAYDFLSLTFQEDINKLRKNLKEKNFHDPLITLDKIVDLFQEETIFNHDMIIEKELQLFLEIANESNLILDPDLDTYYLMDYVINSYPTTLVALKNLEQTIKSNPVDEDKIAAVVEFVSTYEQLQKTLFYISKYNPKLSKQIALQINALDDTLKDLIKILKRSPKMTHHIESLFTKATALSIKVFHCSKEQLHSLLEKKRKYFQQQKKDGIIGLLIFSIIVILITILIFSYDRIAQKNKYLAYHDQLTQVYNIHALSNDLKTTSPYGMLLVDIKKFSNINDFYGEEIGDLILKKVAMTLGSLIKNYQCKLYRVSSDQFILLNYDKAENLCQKIAKKIFQKFTLPTEFIYQKRHYTINLKMRIAKLCGFDVAEIAPEHWKVKVDMALNHAKKKQKDYITYDSQLNLEENIHKEIAILDMVREAILDNRIVPVFQKIEKNDTSSYECLIRIKEKNSNILIPPVAFLDIIKPTPYYQQLTKMMIKKSFDYFSTNSEMFSINFSFSDIIDKSTVKYFLKMVENYNMQGRVIVELLEDESLQNMETIKQFIKKIRQYDIQVAIDDFGSGYSNFHYLTKIQPDYIKIDGSLIKNIDTDEKSYITVKHIHNFAKEIGCKTIAEFVSSKEIFDKVQELGIDGMQGFYIAKPTQEV